MTLLALMLLMSSHLNYIYIKKYIFTTTLGAG